MLGERIRSERLKKKLTQEKLSELINLDRTMISKIENNIAKPSIDALTKIAEALQVKVSELLDHAT